MLQALKRRFVLTASTGVAAVHLNGQTVHSWAGIGLGDKKVDELVSFIKQSSNLLSRWRSVQALVIDEISMISAELFDKLDQIAKAVRDKPTDFGGIQLIVCGDFLQLRPVDGRFAFKASAWKAIKYQVRLNRIYRQSDEPFVRSVPCPIHRSSHCVSELIVRYAGPQALAGVACWHCFRGERFNDQRYGASPIQYERWY
jgi:ATP-dependent exoDNAse (exonuclease V) alpha subunit